MNERKVFFINTGDVPVTQEQCSQIMEAFLRENPKFIEEITRLKDKPDSEIDFSDIPELDTGAWDNATRPGVIDVVRRKPQ